MIDLRTDYKSKLYELTALQEESKHETNPFGKRGIDQSLFSIERQSGSGLLEAVGMIYVLLTGVEP